jgi:O-antigen/teichoic acid export membrane protein
MIRKLFSSQLRINMVSGVATTIVNTIVMMLGYPVYLHFLGYEKYGVWLVLSVVLTFAQLGNLGIGPAVMKLVAEEYGRGNTEGIQRYVTTALWTLSVTGCIALVVIILLAKPIIGLFKLGPENASLAEHFLPYMGILTVYAFLIQILTATLSGLGRMDQANYWDSACRAISLGVVAVLLILGYGIVSLLIGMAINYLLIHVTSVLLIRRIVNLQILKFNWDAKRFRNLVSFGGAVLGGSLVSMLFSPFNKLILSRYAGISTIPVYEIAFTGSMQVRGLIEAAFRALVPEISRIGANMTSQLKHRISQLNRLAMKLIFIFGVPIYAALIVFAPQLLKVWLSDRFVETLPSVFRIMLIGTFLSLLGVPAYYTLMGMGRVRHILGSCIIQSTVNAAIVISCVLLSSMASSGTVVFSASVGMGASTVYLIWQTQKALKYLNRETVTIGTNSEGRIDLALRPWGKRC